MLCRAVTEEVQPQPWSNPRLKGRLPELDGVRGLAILLVLVWHYLVCAIQTVDGSWQAHLLAPLRLTWSGVDLFFVLSGFLIGGILYDAKQSGNYFATFYGRRVYRIFPLYLGWIALFALGLYLTGPDSPSPLRTLFSRDIPGWSYPLFLQNFFMSAHRGFGAEWMGITWSLSLEEQFYLLLPIVVRYLSAQWLTRLAVASIVAAPLIRLSLWSSGNTYFGPLTLLPCRADALGFGILIAIACRNEKACTWLQSRRRHLYPALLILACGIAPLMHWRRYLYVVGITWIDAFYAALLLLAIVNPGKIEIRIFRNPILTTLGTVAYAVYIFHQGINALFHFAIFGTLPVITGWASFGVTLLSLVATLLIAALSWRLLERPLIRHARTAFQYALREPKLAAARL